jgi:hypothetical protein
MPVSLGIAALATGRVPGEPSPRRLGISVARNKEVSRLQEY